MKPKKSLFESRAACMNPWVDYMNPWVTYMDTEVALSSLHVAHMSPLEF